MSKLMKLVSTRLGMTVGVVVALIVVGAIVALAGGGTRRPTQSTAAAPTATQVASEQTTTAPNPLPVVHKKPAATRKHASSSSSTNSSAASSGSAAGGSTSSSSANGGSAAGGSAASGCGPSGSSAGTGELVVYGNPPAPQFKPVLDAFAKAYPSIKVNYSDQGDSVSFSKYRAEHAQGARTADMIIASSPVLWDNNRDIALCWKPNDAAAYPSFRTQFPGVFILSPDPAVSLYSKAKLPANGVPATFAQLESDLKQHPDLFNKKIATYTVDNDFGYSAFWGMAQQRGWSTLNNLGPASKPQADGTAIAQQIASGGSNYAFFESGLVRGALTGAVSQVVGWQYMRDFTPLVPRGVAVTKGAANPAAAKAFLNWAYSAPGQQVMCAAGFTAFRTGVSCSNSLASVQQAVGAANVFLVPFHSTIAQDHAAFTSRWHQVFG